MPRPRLEVDGGVVGQPEDTLGDKLGDVLRAMREEQEGGVSPDLSETVMRQLGFRRATARASRRERIGRWVRRASSALAVLALAGGTLWVVHTSRLDRTRDSSMEEVVRASLEHKSRLLGDLAECVRPFDQLQRTESTGLESDLPGGQRPARTPAPPTIPQPLRDEARPAEAPHKRA
ncbi:MAG: hypothetical protein JNL80_00410 [Phycisphaerae bacterium]|nr:hypothetical protein [Phycisphaerae bacterium]